jgi:hypothetical protein
MGEIKILFEIEDIDITTENKVSYLMEAKEYDVVDFLSLAWEYNILPAEKSKQWEGDLQISSEKTEEERQKIREQERQQRQQLINYYTVHFQELVDLFKENPQALKGDRFPCQVLYPVLTNTTGFPLKSLEEKDFMRAIEGIIFENFCMGGIREFGREIPSPSPNREKYYVELIVTEDEKEENKDICKKKSEVLLLKEFRAQTDYGKVVSFPIEYQLLDMFSKTSDFVIITSVLDKAFGYFFSSDLSNSIEKYLLTGEYSSLPQMDISDYVKELGYIIRSPIFSNICELDKIDIIREWLENVKKGIYSKSMSGAVEHILREIAESLSIHERGDMLYRLLRKLAGEKENKNRRLLPSTEALIKALDRNPRTHWSAKRLKHDEKYFTMLDIKAIRDVYYDYCLFESLDICLKEIAGENKRYSEDLWNEYYDDILKGGNQIKYDFKENAIFLTLGKHTFDVDLLNKTVKEVLA